MASARLTVHPAGYLCFNPNRFAELAKLGWQRASHQTLLIQNVKNCLCQNFCCGHHLMKAPIYIRELRGNESLLKCSGCSLTTSRSAEVHFAD